MSYQAAKESYAAEIAEIKAAGLWKTERVIASEQKNDITLESGANVVNMCANNYLGLANNAEVMQAASDSLGKWGFGAASVRFICGTQGIHKTLEHRVSQFLGMEDTILYAACFDANTGLFETILGPEDAVVSDELNHASIIDGVRLCKASRYRYRNSDMDRPRGQATGGARRGRQTNPHHDRWCVLDGRHHCSARCHLRSGR